MKEKIKLTHEQIQKIAEGINVICFKRNPKKPDEYVLLEYPRVDFFHQSCIWKDPSFDYDHQKEVKLCNKFYYAYRNWKECVEDHPKNR